MDQLPNCPKCNSEYTYNGGSLLVCPECAYEWNPEEEQEEIKENLKSDAIQERREKIAMLTEKFKNDPVRLAVLSQLAEDLNNI